MDAEPITPNLQPLAGLDRLVHEPGRLLVLTCLYLVDRADYLYVLKQCGLTQGNLSSHLAKLEAGGYIQMEKRFEGKTPRTQLSLTPAGREAFRSYRAQILGALAGLPA